MSLGTRPFQIGRRTDRNFLIILVIARPTVSVSDYRRVVLELLHPLARYPSGSAAREAEFTRRDQRPKIAPHRDSCGRVPDGRDRTAETQGTTRFGYVPVRSICHCETVSDPFSSLMRTVF